MSLARLFGQTGEAQPLAALVGHDRNATLRTIENKVRRGDVPDPSHMAWMVYTLTHVMGDAEARETWLRSQLDQRNAELAELRAQSRDNRNLIDYLLGREARSEPRT